MKRRLRAALLLLLALAPMQARAAGNIFTDVTGTLGMHVQEWMNAAAVQATKDLEITLALDSASLAPNDAAQVQVTLMNPRLHACTVDYSFTASEQDAVTIAGDAQQETLALPPARMLPDGSITPATLERTYVIKASEETAEKGDGLQRLLLAATLREGSRWYQRTQGLALCAPRISAVLHASNTEPAPQETFFYEVSLTNSGGAAGSAEVALVLPDGVAYAPQPLSATPAEAEPVMRRTDDASDCAPIVRGNMLQYTVRVPAATFDADGAMTQAASTTLRVPVTVDAQALEGEEDAVRLLSCGASLDGRKLQSARVTVRGPRIACRLVPSLRDMNMDGTLHYTCEIENSGYTPADVLVTFQVPAGLKFTRFVTRGLQNKVAGDTLSWVVHLDAAQFDLAGDAIPARATLTWQVRAQTLSSGVSALLIPATAVYQIGSGMARATDVVLTTVHRPTFLGLSRTDWVFLVCGGAILLATAATLIALIRHDGAKGD